MQYTDVDKVSDSKYVKRFGSMLIRWGKMYGEEDAQRKMDIILQSDNFIEFRETIQELVVFGGISSFAHYKRGFLQFLELVNADEPVTAYIIKMEYAENLTKSTAWNSDGKLTENWNTEKLNRIYQNSTGTSQLYKKDSNVEQDIGITYVASPQHLIYLLNTCYGEYPDSMCIALCFVWLGIPVAEATKILKFQMNEDCTLYEAKNRVQNICEPIATYLREYRDREIEFSPGKNTYYPRYKDGVYFLERIYCPKKIQTIDNPIPTSNLYAKITDLNVCLTQKLGKKYLLTSNGIRRSSVYYDTYKAYMQTDLPIRKLVSSKTNGVKMALQDYTGEYNKWLAEYNKTIAEHPEFQ